jgi:DNA-directed RNA polymerase subunit N (RpoN/RPB10)
VAEVISRWVCRRILLGDVQEDIIGLGGDGDEDEEEDAGGSKVVRGVSGESYAISDSPISISRWVCRRMLLG